MVNKLFFEGISRAKAAKKESQELIEREPDDDIIILMFQRLWLRLLVLSSEFEGVTFLFEDFMRYSKKANVVTLVEI